MDIYSEGVDTAVIVLSYNGKPYHRNFFPLLISESTNLYDVILVDNASTDDTLEYVQVEFPSVKTIHLNVNEGFTGGYIHGINQIKGYKYFILLSADFEVTPDWFQPLHLQMESHAHLGACQPKIKYQKDKEYFEYAGAAGGFMDRYGYFFCRGRIFDSLEKDDHQYDTDIQTFWAGGGCLMVRSSLYHHLGGLEKSLYAHMEEIDLCWRMKNAGYAIACISDSTVYHVGGSVISYGSPQKLFHNFRNNLLIFVKNYHGIRFWPWLLQRLILDGIAALQFLMQGSWVNFVTVIKAHFSFYKMLPKFWKKRVENRKYLSKNPNTAGAYNGSIIIDYYFRKKRKFSELPIDTKSL